MKPITPESRSLRLLSKTRAKAKMYEYGISEEFHINISQDRPDKLMSLAIGMLGNHTAVVSRIPLSNRFDDIKTDLKFSAQYFEAYYKSKLDSPVEPYLVLLGAASYYLCDLPGSSRVLIRSLGECPPLEGEGLEFLIFWLLKYSYGDELEVPESAFEQEIQNLKNKFILYRQSGVGANDVYSEFSLLKDLVYEWGSARQLLFCDIVGAIIRVAYENSTWRCLPEYTGLSVGVWENSIKKGHFMKELWPSQHMLGKQGVFKGTSAVIQMPTSAGKTKATEIIIRSAFLAGRTSLAVIVAPFRALCHEIRSSLAETLAGDDITVEEFSDVIQDDIEITSPEVRYQVYVVTPEKLVYVLRQAPEFADNIGLLIYDEGHQFDSQGRGVTFELLLTTLKTIVNNAQTVLISAVLSNVDAINSWLNKQNSEIVSGANLLPTYRSIAFASWKGTRGQLVFVNAANNQEVEFFVPRVIEEYRLERKGRERSQRFFPKKAEPGKKSDNTVSLYLGLKLVPNGGVAVFCGTKLTAISLSKILVDAYDRNLQMVSPSSYSNQEEIIRLLNLHVAHLGEESIFTQAARLGVYNHHSNIPNGIRMAIEFSIREGLTKFVLCTSTLSQGVNLPIRYLIIASVQQGYNRPIKVRDFHNLLGRAGRSGMYTEGNVIFANPDIYDGKAFNKDSFQWNNMIKLLQADRAEPCDSALFSVFDNFTNEDGKIMLVFEILEFAKLYLDGQAMVNAFVDSNYKNHGDKGFTREALSGQINDKVKIFETVESYLMSYASDSGHEDISDIDEIVQNTLAYHLADSDGRIKLLELFRLLSKNINELVPELARKRVFGKTLYGVNKSLMIESFVKEKYSDIIRAESGSDLLRVLWRVIELCCSNKFFVNITQPELIFEIALKWIKGNSFNELLQFVKSSGAEYKRGKSTIAVSLEQLIDLCLDAFSFEGSLALGAIGSIFSYLSPETPLAYDRILGLQKRLQYGLPSAGAIFLYELGFADRVVALELSKYVGVPGSKYEVVDALRRAEGDVRRTLDKYPAFFVYTLDIVLGKS